MSERETYVWEQQQWETVVDAIIDAYDRRGGDHEHTHGREDDLLEHYIRDRAFEGDSRAMAIVRLLDHERVRWYA